MTTDKPDLEETPEEPTEAPEPPEGYSPITRQDIIIRNLLDQIRVLSFRVASLETDLLLSGAPDLGDPGNAEELDEDSPE